MDQCHRTFFDEYSDNLSHNVSHDYDLLSDALSDNLSDILSGNLSGDHGLSLHDVVSDLHVCLLSTLEFMLVFNDVHDIIIRHVRTLPELSTTTFQAARGYFTRNYHMLVWI